MYLLIERFNDVPLARSNESEESLLYNSFINFCTSAHENPLNFLLKEEFSYLCAH